MPSSPAELVVVFREDAVADARSTVEAHLRAGRRADIVLRPLVSHAALALERVERLGVSPAVRANRQEKARFFTAVAPDRDVDAALGELRALPGVETAYLKPGVENPVAPPSDVPLPSPPRGVRPGDFRVHQGYLDAAPAGVNVDVAWRRRGGRGAGVRVIDIEGGWQLTHSDLRANAGGLLAGEPYTDDALGWRNHGTAVLGEMGGDLDGIGVSGICPDAMLSCVSHGGGLGSARAIEIASTLLGPGDVLLLEMHRPGPRCGFLYNAYQLGYIAVEWWPDDLAAIQGAVAKGITVVEAAGNGGDELDDAFYDTPYPGFPRSWRNPFGGAVDSGAILVGAGAPPTGSFGPDRSRLDFSNFGRRVDCQGWGHQVVTTGYGSLYVDPQAPDDEDFWYECDFDGTSSASPIVAGVVACLQGIAKARGRALAPGAVRAALRATGSPQQPGPQAPLAETIGSRPDLDALIRYLGL